MTTSIFASLDTQYLRSVARAEIGAPSAWPVVIVPGNAPPVREGESYYWTTPSGKTVVCHPNAYGWRTWYHCSTLCVVVGAEWLRVERDRRHEAWRAA
jgi:hypothetical protein